MERKSTFHVSVFPRGSHTPNVQPFHDGHIGSVDLGSVTIQSTNPDDLDELARALHGAARMMRDASRGGYGLLREGGEVPA